VVGEVVDGPSKEKKKKKKKKKMLFVGKKRKGRVTLTVVSD